MRFWRLGFENLFPYSYILVVSIVLCSGVRVEIPGIDVGIWTVVVDEIEMQPRNGRWLSYKLRPAAMGKPA